MRSGAFPSRLMRGGAIVALGLFTAAVAWAASIEAGTARFQYNRITDPTGMLATDGTVLSLGFVDFQLSCGPGEKLVSGEALSAAGSTKTQDFGSNTQSKQARFENIPVTNTAQLLATCPKNKVSNNQYINTPVTVEFRCRKSDGKVYQKAVDKEYHARVDCDTRPYLPAVAKQVMWKHECPPGYTLVETKGGKTVKVRSSTYTRDQDYSNPMTCECEKAGSDPASCKPVWPKTSSGGSGPRG
jgi:hypothetical protein